MAGATTQHKPQSRARSVATEPVLPKPVSAAKSPNHLTVYRMEPVRPKSFGGATFTLPYPLTTNNLYRSSKDGKRYKTKENVDYHEEAGLRARPFFPSPLAGIRLHVEIFYMPKKGRGMDLDNVCKCALDSLTGIAWVDDSMIWELFVKRIERDPDRNDDLIIRIKEIM